MSQRAGKWIFILIIVVVGAFALLGPDYTDLSFFRDGYRAQLIHDDHELGVFQQRGSWVTQGITPYDISIFQEYPQVGLGYITLPYIFSDQYGYYRWILITMNTILAVSLLWVTIILLHQLKRSVWFAALLVLPAMLFFTFSRFDILVALLVQVGLWLVLSRRWRWAGAVLGLAILTKWYPVLFLPLVYAYVRQTCPEQTRAALRSFWWSVGLVVGGIMAISFFIDGFTSLRPYLFHGARSGGVGSLYFMLIEGPLQSTGIVQLDYLGLTIFLILQFAVPLFVIFKTTVVQRWLRSPHQLVLWMALAVLVFTFFSRFYSPQWIIWFVPLVVLIGDRRLAGLVVGYDLLNYLSFPLIWQVWGPFSWQFISVSLLIVALQAGVLWRLFGLMHSFSANPAKGRSIASSIN